jgi:putative protease
MKETFKTQLSKTGESNFYVKSVEIQDKIGFMPVSAINELRRNLLENLEQERLKNYSPLTQGELNYAKFPLEKYDYRANILNKKAGLPCFFYT